MRILVIEDDASVLDYISRGLRESGFTVDQAADGKDGLFRASAEKYDALVVDRMLPGVDGLTIIRTLRGADNNTPALILSALGEVDDRVKGLKAGGDDYLVKPFALSELVARLRALVRRHDMRRSEQFILAALRYDAAARRAWIGERAVALSARECIVLQYLMLRTGQIVPREQFAALVPGWGATTSNNALELLMSRLRAKIEPAGVRLRTVRGLGYLLEPAAPA